MLLRLDVAPTFYVFYTVLEERVEILLEQIATLGQELWIEGFS